ncbi:BQ5605_C036g11524 [Microbotryum silenes-dioicae]|uniref:BQ5605_C036g11524 protein n=1 Tax=Microbotryum silenes-dioicae TaxID=796604 RepID=A0A2X0MIT9_9BASI|nr:BQ5605_C036g11524 [Microbotryum silenes-dioicae]
MALSLSCSETEGSSPYWGNGNSAPRLNFGARTAGRCAESSTNLEARDTLQRLDVLDHSGRAMSTGSGEDWYGSQVPDRNKRSIQAPSTLLHDGSSEHGLATSRKRWGLTREKAMDRELNRIHRPLHSRQRPGLDGQIGARRATLANAVNPRCLGDLLCREPTVPILLTKVTPFHCLPPMLQHTQLFRRTTPWIDVSALPRMHDHNDLSTRSRYSEEEAPQFVTELHHIKSPTHDHWRDFIWLPQEQTHLHPAAFASADRKQWDEAFSPDSLPGFDAPSRSVSAPLPGHFFSTSAESTRHGGLGQATQAHDHGQLFSAHLPALPSSAMGCAAGIELDPEEPEPFSLAALQHDLEL